MAILASDVLEEARSALLNDASGAIYTDTQMYPIIAKVYRELQTKLAAHGFSTSKEMTTTVVLTAGDKLLDPAGGLDPAFLFPIALGERNVGSTGSFTDMTESMWEPDLRPRTDLVYWTWREEALQFVGATTDRELSIKYLKALSPIIGANTPILIQDCQSWMAQRTAVIAAATIGGNPTRAGFLAGDLVEIWDDLKAIRVKQLQNIPVRRRRTRWRRAQ